MPVVKVPVVHKFGIISHSHRLQLQKRLIEKQYAESVSQHRFSASRNPLGVTEAFIQQFNGCKNFADKTKLEEVARKMLERVKRRAGLKEGGDGAHVDLPVAWTELSQLAQCKGKVQEDCLDALITSLDQAVLDKEHIPALFYLGETCLYYLRTEAANEPYLRAAEIKLLKMGQMVFTRLFYHHMAGGLKGFADFKTRLYTYLNGFIDCQESYSPYPNALLSIRYINEVGKIIIGEALMDAGQADNSEPRTRGAARDFIPEHTVDDRRRTTFPEDADDDDDDRRAMSGATTGLSSSVHDLSPTLWHSLDVWRCVAHLGGGLSDALRALNNCGLGLAAESWIDAIGALTVMGEASKADPRALQTFQALAQGTPPRTTPAPSSPHEIEPSDYPTTSPTTRNEDATTMTARTALSDIDERTEEAESPDSRRLEDFDVDDDADSIRPDPYRLAFSEREKLLEEEQEEDDELTGLDGADDMKTPGSRGDGLQTTDPAPGTAWHAEVGSDWGDTRLSGAATVRTFGNEAFPDLAGIQGWRWEVAFAYTELLADVCFRGTTSVIQKMALVGKNRDLDMIHRKYSQILPLTARDSGVESAGLLDMLYFRASKEDDAQGPNDWSWRVRYSAVQGLVKLCRCLEKDALRSGLRTAAWNALIKAHSVERDQRVLEAYRVGQVGANIESLLSRPGPRGAVVTTGSPLGARLAAGLASLYLPPLPPPVEPRATPQPRPAPRPKARGGARPTPRRREQLRTTLQEELMLATALHEKPPAYFSRQDFDLRRIVEDQWRKDLQQGLALEDRRDKQQHSGRRRQEEQLERQKAAAKEAKFGRSGVDTGKP